MSHSAYQRAGAVAIKAYLEDHASVEAVTIAFLAEGIADPAARKAGKKNDLFESLWSYEQILSRGAEVFYSDSQAKVRNPYYCGVRVEKPQVALAGPFDVGIDFGPGRAYMPHSVVP